MARKVYIEQSFDYQLLVIGIASTERVWKLCHEVNRALGISLQESRSEHPGGPAEPPATDSPEGLFGQEAPGGAAGPYYEDHSSHPEWEYALAALPAARLPREARAFRYALLVRCAGTAAPDPDDLIARLSTAPAVLSAMDLSQVKNIKSLLP